MEKNLPRKVVTLSPYCKDLSGHPFPYYLALDGICKKIGWASDFYISHNAEIPKSFSFKKWFRNTNNRLFRMFLRFFDYRKCLQILSKQDVILLESYSLSDLIALLLALYSVKNKPGLLFFIRDGMEAFPKKRILFFYLMKKFKSRLENKMIFVSDSSKIIKSSEKLLHYPVDLLPIPHTSHIAKKVKSQKDLFSIWIPGNPDGSRGKDQAIQLSSLLKGVQERYQLRISEKYEPHLQKSHKLFYLPSFLSEEEYANQFLQSNLLFLPYDPKIYSSRTSGIFVEALIAKTYVVVLEGSWLAFELKKYDLTELIFKKEEIDDLFLHRLESILKSDIIAKKYERMHQSYVSYHNEQSFKKEFERLLQTF